MAVFSAFCQTFNQNVLNMKKYFNSTLGRLRLFAFLEGISLLILIMLAVPLKYLYDNPQMVKILGPIHGALFLVFLFNSLRVGIEQDWKFGQTTWKVLLACFIPFGTFYIDYTLLRIIHGEELNEPVG